MMGNSNGYYYAQQGQHQHQHQHQHQQSAVMAPKAQPAGGMVTRSDGGPEDITTIFVVGFPMDMTEREFTNMFTFCPGFEAATLKVPTHEELMDSSLSGAKKQIIGFARFRTRLQALEARDILSGRKVDPDGVATLKAEMARKNMHVKRTLANELYHPAFHQYSALTLAAAAAAHAQSQSNGQSAQLIGQPHQQQQQSASAAFAHGYAVAATTSIPALASATALPPPAASAIAAASGATSAPAPAPALRAPSMSSSNSGGVPVNQASDAQGLPALESLFAPSAAASPTREQLAASSDRASAPPAAYFTQQQQASSLSLDHGNVRRFATPPPSAHAHHHHSLMAATTSPTVSTASEPVVVASIGVATSDTASVASSISVARTDSPAPSAAGVHPVRRGAPPPLAINTSLANRWPTRGPATLGGAVQADSAMSPTTPVCQFPGAMHPAALPAKPASKLSKFDSVTGLANMSLNYDSSQCSEESATTSVLYVARIPAPARDGTSIASVGAFAGFVRAAVGASGVDLWLEFATPEHAKQTREWVADKFGGDQVAVFTEGIPRDGVMMMGGGGGAGEAMGVERSMTL